MTSAYQAGFWKRLSAMTLQRSSPYQSCDESTDQVVSAQR
jgi:hypothetical protein